MDRLPGVFFVGPERTGTTWIHRYLALRGDVCLPTATKETFFFDRHFERGVAWYLSHFGNDLDRPLMAEVAPTYFHQAQVGARIAALVPQAHVVCTLRDPVKRSYSAYQHMRAYGATNAPLQQAVIEHPQILDASRYASHVQRLRAQLGAQRVHVLLLDDLAADSEAFARRICEITGLTPRPPPPELRAERVNATGAPRHPRLARLGFMIRGPLRRARWFGPIAWARRLGLQQLFFGVRESGGEPTAEDLHFLRRQLAGEVERIEALLGRALPQWHAQGDGS
ncbi:sulfotransferase family protein [Sinimarinibacterium thermocellulolyticum]|uniref:Sulfotransferase n=1 Tax=Sinimarinibacterium thermocellulolyticum TaxID=3170016 RepID=A0ABV2A9K9_9GAMM